MTKTTKQFIEQARKVHNDKYDYSKSNYTKAREKICIICPKHGEFWMTPDNHLRGQGCPVCGAENRHLHRRMKLDEFIKRAKEVHGDKYDYSKVEYVNCETKVCIICPKHGEFWQTPHVHLNGHGCPKCKFEKLSKEQFAIGKIEFEKIKEKNKDFLDYSLSEYKGMHTKILVKCLKCGKIFWQEPDAQKRGNKCPYCAGKNKTTKDFIEQAKKIHGNKYDYSKSEYIKAKTKTCIICPEHGEFWQTPDKHLRGQGCPICSESHLEKEVSKILDDLNIKYIPQYSNLFLGLQKLDFYLPDYKIGIECQGIQHFKPVDFANKGKEWANKFYKVNKERDKCKKIKCDKNNVKLLYFTKLNYKTFLKENLLHTKNDIKNVLKKGFVE